MSDQMFSCCRRSGEKACCTTFAWLVFDRRSFDAWILWATLSLSSWPLDSAKVWVRGSSRQLASSKITTAPFDEFNGACSVDDSERKKNLNNEQCCVHLVFKWAWCLRETGTRLVCVMRFHQVDCGARWIDKSENSAAELKKEHKFIVLFFFLVFLFFVVEVV